MLEGGAQALRLAADAFQALPVEAALVDRDGVVVLVNDAWREFTRANGGGDACGPGSDYLAVCARAARAGDELAGVVEAALTAVLHGHAPQAQLDYPCHGPQAQRWYRMRAQALPGCGHALVLHEEISEHVQEREQLHHLATHDPLTGLPNRVLLQERLARALAEVDRRAVGGVGVLVLDLDGFKGVNDVHGHPAGDALLRVVAGRLERVGRARDTVGRWGGDEFVAVLPGCTPRSLDAVRERLARAVAEPVDLGLVTVRVTATAGGAVAGRGDDPAALLAAADRALLRAKAARPA